MKTQLFQVTQKHFAALGFIPNHNFNKYHIQNIVIVVSTIASQYLYLQNEAATIDDYIQPIFMGTSVIAAEVTYITTIFKTIELYEFIENFKKMADQCE